MAVVDSFKDAPQEDMQQHRRDILTVLGNLDNELSTHAADRSAFEAASKVALDTIGDLTEKVKALEEDSDASKDRYNAVVARHRERIEEERTATEDALARVAALEAKTEKQETEINHLHTVTRDAWTTDEMVLLRAKISALEAKTVTAEAEALRSALFTVGSGGSNCRCVVGLPCVDHLAAALADLAGTK